MMPARDPPSKSGGGSKLRMLLAIVALFSASLYLSGFADDSPLWGVRGRGDRDRFAEHDATVNPALAAGVVRADRNLLAAGAAAEAERKGGAAEPPKLRLEPMSPEDRFFPFSYAKESDGNCVTEQEVLDISGGIRELLAESKIRVFPRNGFLLGIIRHGGFLPNEHVDADMGIVSTDLDRWKDKVSAKGSFHAGGFAFKLKPTETWWVNWKGLDPETKEPYPFFGVNIHLDKLNIHASSVYVYPYGEDQFFYPRCSIKKLNAKAHMLDMIRWNKEGADVRLVDSDTKLESSNYEEGVQMGNILDTKLDCFVERQFYFTTIPVPCDYDVILTSLYGKNWNKSESRGELDDAKDGREIKFESHVVSEEENKKILFGGPRPVCMT
mmetsp:Transcript_32912/g.70066  ORF Transcript_32912/g.70066 Transcript_32912/m.70066 type:complete len:383 (-) Transcript_32912:81-1229(-)